jgi:hypothetical protein
VHRAAAAGDGREERALRRHLDAAHALAERCAAEPRHVEGDRAVLGRPRRKASVLDLESWLVETLELTVAARL